MRQRIIAFLLAVIMIGAVLMAFRVPILRSFSTVLIAEDELEKVEAMAVLSGGGYDRGNEAVNIYKAGWTNKIICTGGNPELNFRIIGIDTLESDLTAINLQRQVVPDSAIVLIRKGTSTLEESDIILAYCKKQNIKKIMVLSSKIHCRRVRSVFAEKFENANIQIIYRGAKSSIYDELNWWKKEEGLIAINNEWMKTFYYWLKY
jgi:uncharacterized SAM-binding protein YcdF (DUF218 family)